MAEQTNTTNQEPAGGQLAAQTQTGGHAQTASNYDEIFAKMDAVLDKRSDGLARSVLKDNGIDEGEAAEIARAYKERKQAEAAQRSKALTDAQATIADLRKQIADRCVDDALTAAALGLGIDAKQLPYVTRLAVRDGILGDNGEADADKAKAAIDKVLEDVPALKASTNTNGGFVTVGSKGGEGAASPDEANKKLRSYFGLK